MSRDEDEGASLAYWRKQDVSVNGVMGGYAHLSGVDIRDSKNFLDKLQKRCDKGNRKGMCHPLKLEGRAADLAAGIGRVTKELLMSFSHQVDLFEPVASLAEAARIDLKDAACACTVYETRMQDFDPPRGAYDLIWIQWGAMYLDDAEVSSLISRCLRGLKETGAIVVKDNLDDTAECSQFDPEDASRRRAMSTWQSLFEAAGAEVTLSVEQRGWPKHLYRVNMFALRHPIDLTT